MSILETEVVGCIHYYESYPLICNCNSKYYSQTVSKREYELYPFTGNAVLCREPNNAHDKNAVMVLVNGHKIGYISASEAPEIGALLKSGRINGVTVRITGGNYKEPRLDSAGNRFIVPDSSPLRARLEINVKETNRAVLLLLCVFGGYLGLHRFYRREILWGLIYLFTAGLFFIGWFYDIFRIAVGKMK